jgi:hypothetical protein
VVSAEYTCFLTHSGEAAPIGGEARGGAQGWTISLTADNASITAITTGIGEAGDPLTKADEFYNGGFNQTQVTTDAAPGSACEGKNGAVSAVVLSFTSGATLEADTKSSIAILSVEATIPALADSPDTATLAYVDGCRGLGQPVPNNVTHAGASVKPNVSSTDIELRFKEGPKDCSGQLALGFSASSVRVVGGDAATLIDELAGTGQDGGVDTIEVTGAAADVYVGIISPYDELEPTDEDYTAVQGWSVAVALEGDDVDFAYTVGPLPADVSAQSRAGTAAATVADGGYESGGFVQNQVVDPAKEPTSGALAGLGAQGKGVVSAVVLSFTSGATLPPRGVESVLKIPLEASAPSATAVLRCKSGLQGLGQPVNNVATVKGETAEYCNADTSVTVAFDRGPAVNLFVRGDPNNDGKVNIADPIWIVNELFRSGPPTLCQDAADANNDGSVDVSDVTYLIEYEFLGGSAPPAPFPACGEDPEGDEDGVTCETQQSACD